jgi:Secretion system C-terminal sorting domain
MKFKYETLGMSTGRGNSFARKLDGDCGWVKQPQISGNATNNTGSATSDVSYSMTIVQSQDCDATHGVLDIYVNVSTNSYSTVFPMNYTIAFDANHDGAFDFSDQYTYGVDSTPPSINITGLPMGHYNITVASVMGCYLHTFPVDIMSCTGVLPLELVYFKLKETKYGSGTFEWMLGGMEQIRSIELEKSQDGVHFTTAYRMDSLTYSGTRIFDHLMVLDPEMPYYRLRISEKSGHVFYSSIITNDPGTEQSMKIWPNPVIDQVHVQLTSNHDQKANYKIYSMAGSLAAEGTTFLHAGANQLTFSTGHLPAGTYQILLSPAGNGQPFSMRFVKP